MINNSGKMAAFYIGYRIAIRAIIPVMVYKLQILLEIVPLGGGVS